MIILLGCCKIKRRKACHSMHAEWSCHHDVVWVGLVLLLELTDGGHQ